MKKFVATKHHSFKFAFTFSVVVVDLPTDCISSFLFPAETDVLVPVFSQSTDFVVALKFPILKENLSPIGIFLIIALCCAVSLHPNHRLL